MRPASCEAFASELRGAPSAGAVPEAKKDVDKRAPERLDSSLRETVYILPESGEPQGDRRAAINPVVELLKTLALLIAAAAAAAAAGHMVFGLR